MKFQKTVLQSAVALAFGSAAVTASAGDIGTTTQTLASNIFGTGSAALVIAPSGLTYQLGQTIASGQAFSFYVALSGGAKWAGVPAAFCVDAVGAPQVGPVQISTNGTFIVASIPASVAGYGAVISTCTVTGGTMTNLAALGTPGSSINGTVTLDGGPPSVAAVPTGATNIDTGGNHTGPYFTSAQALSGTITPSSAFSTTTNKLGVPESLRIDVGATPALAAFLAPAGGATNTASPGGLVNLGAVVFNEVAGIQDDGTGAANDYTLAKIANFDGNVTGDFGAVGATGAVFTASDAACAAPTGLGVLDAAKTKATFTGLAPTAAKVPTYVCFATDGKTVIVPQTPRADFTLNPIAATDQTFTVGPSDLYTLTTNGALVTIRYHLPGGTPGYTQFYRFANNGTLATPVRGTPIAEDGTFGTTGVLIADLLPNEVRSMTNAEVQTALAFAPAANARPRLQISGATQNLTVQNFLCGPDGTCVEISTGQSVPPVNPTNP
jgi:hypothetical protein